MGDVICIPIPYSQRKQQKDLLAAIQKVVVPIYCTSFLAVEEEKQQKITRVNSMQTSVARVINITLLLLNLSPTAILLFTK